MIKQQLFIAAALFTGVAIGYFLKPDAPVDGRTDAADRGYVAASKIGDGGEAASLRALRARIAELEKRLAEKRAEKPAEPVAEKTPSADARGDRHGPPSMAEMRARLEKLKKENPEEFARREKHMAQWRERRLDRASRRLDFLSAVDTATMTDAQKKTHEQYQALIAKRENLEADMHRENMTDEEREAAFKAMHETDREMRRVARQERETLLDQTVKSLGFSEDDAKAVGDTLREVISTTENGHNAPPPPDGEGPNPR